MSQGDEPIYFGVGPAGGAQLWSTAVSPREPDLGTQQPPASSSTFPCPVYMSLNF